MVTHTGEKRTKEISFISGRRKRMLYFSFKVRRITDSFIHSTWVLICQGIMTHYFILMGNDTF